MFSTECSHVEEAEHYEPAGPVAVPECHHIFTAVTSDLVMGAPLSGVNMLDRGRTVLTNEERAEE